MYMGLACFFSSKKIPKTLNIFHMTEKFMCLERRSALQKKSSAG